MIINSCYYKALRKYQQTNFPKIFVMRHKDCFNGENGRHKNYEEIVLPKELYDAVCKIEYKLRGVFVAPKVVVNLACKEYAEMKKGTQIFICGSVDVILTFVMICWLLFISQGYNSIQWIIIVLGWIVLFSKIFFWDKMRERYETKNIKGYKNPEVSVDIGGDTYKIKVVNEGEE
jgi:hypothetical protein